MERIIMKTRKLVVVSVAVAMLSGCGTVRLCYTERPKETDISSSMKQGHVFNRKPIVGKGFDVLTRGQVEAKITTKDGSIVEIKTMKTSFFEKMMGWLYIVKPNNVGVGGK